MTAAVKASGTWGYGTDVAMILQTGRVFLTQGFYGDTAMVMDTSMNQRTATFAHYPDTSSETYHVPIGADGSTDYVLRSFVDNNKTIRVQLWSITAAGATAKTDEWTYTSGIPGVSGGSIAKSYTGSFQTFVVPAGVTTLYVECLGAQGQSRGALNSRPGGFGGFAFAELAVTPGETLRVYVPRQQTGIGVGDNTFGNGTGGLMSSNGGAGGGAADVRRSPYGLGDRLIVAGGGGGAGALGTSGLESGAGGGSIGEAGEGGIGVAGGGGGGGGTQSAGGAGGTSSSACAFGTPQGTAGSLGQGGNGGPTGAGCLGQGGGGGGGGYYGGGGGGAEGSHGGGGSNYVPVLTEFSSQQGANSGNGRVDLAWDGERNVLMDVPLPLNSSKVAMSTYAFSNGPGEIVQDWVFTRSGGSLVVEEVTPLIVDHPDGDYEVHPTYTLWTNSHGSHMLSARHDGPLSYFVDGGALLQFNTDTNTVAYVDYETEGPRWDNGNAVYENYNPNPNFTSEFLYDGDSASIYMPYSSFAFPNQRIERWTPGERAVFTHEISDGFFAGTTDSHRVAWQEVSIFTAYPVVRYRVYYANKRTAAQLPEPPSFGTVTGTPAEYIDVVVETVVSSSDFAFVTPWHRGALLSLTTPIGDSTRWWYLEDSLVPNLAGNLEDVRAHFWPPPQAGN